MAGFASAVEPRLAVTTGRPFLTIAAGDWDRIVAAAVQKKV
jgi:hypothetical protein